ncbi:hypothetical protein DK419_13490 [Methylobacterium terrae]|uniref:Uncharacterized protein n=1 Tax=Methylobacterium terrae TaxID=2202827 RepID=A0A2U8WPI7_9HYPH|nr:hypothetical protein [Methylobacterium terrae]AWN47206.1 hypothetical protein DK419_13490 [Methylobacterium terrae]
MQGLLYILLAVLAFAIVALCGGLWLLHSAINDGNIWKGIVASGLTGGASFFVVMIGGGLAAR